MKDMHRFWCIYPKDQLLCRAHVIDGFRFGRMRPYFKSRPLSSLARPGSPPSPVPSPTDAIPGYSRDINGIAMAVTELLSLDNCVASHESARRATEVRLGIAFSVSTGGEVADLTIESADAPKTGIDSCIKYIECNTLHREPAIPVQLH